MNGKEYNQLAQVTEPKDWTAVKGRVDDTMVRLLHSALGLSSELSELRDALVKAKNANAIDYVNLQEEAGDLAWYTAIAISALGVNPEIAWPEGCSNTLCAPIESLSLTVDGLVVSVGEFNNQLKRALFYGKKPEFHTMEELVQAVAYGVYCLAYEAGSDLSTVQERNIAKLKARYGEKFSEYAALNRDLKTERDVLEGK